MAHAAAQAAGSAQGTLGWQKKGKASRAGDYAKRVRAKFRYGVARSGQRVFLNFDLTPFASVTPFASSDPNSFQAGAAHYKPHRAKNSCAAKRPEY